MGQAAPTALVRLREADVVRLCGLAAAARGIELASHRAIGALRREGLRLSGIVTPTTGGAALEQRIAVWAELASEDALPANLRWDCSQHSAPTDVMTATAAAQPDQPALPTAVPAGGQGCEHVAALLTTWIRAPADFQTPAPFAPAQPRIAGETPPMPQLSPSPHAPLHAADAVVQPRLLAPERAARSPQPPHPTGNTLADALARLNNDALLVLARRVLGVEATEPSAYAAQEARRRLITTLTDPPLARALVARLENGAQALLTDLLLLGGAITGTDLDAYAVRAGHAPAATRADMTLLERHGLVFAASGAGALAPRDDINNTNDAANAQRFPERQSERRWGDITGWRIPPEIRAALPVTLPAPQGEQPRGRLERAAPRQLLQALALLARAPHPLGVWPLSADDAEREERRDGVARDIGRQNERVERRGTSAFTLIPGDLSAATVNEAARGANMPPGLVRLARRVLLWIRQQDPGQPIADVATVPVDERALALRAAFRLWRSVASPADLADLDGPHSSVRLRVDATSPVFQPAAVAAEAAAGRAFALNLIALTPPVTWYPLADFLALAWRIHPLLLRGRQQAYSSPAWWIERRRDGRPLRPTVYDEWMAAEGAWLRLLIEGPLRWWGALDLLTDTSADGATLAFRLTPFGAWLLADDTAPLDAVAVQRTHAALQDNGGPAALPTHDGALAVQPLAAGEPLLTALDRWARPTNIAGGRLIYTFTPELACAAFDQGAQLNELLATMRAVNADTRTGGRIPDRAIQMVGERLAAWRAAYGQARIETGLALLEARDEATLVEALAFAPEIAARCRHIALGVVLIPPADLAALGAILAAKGYHL
ncbi:MAG: hypothetical protein ABI068_09200 [Ktedonobacterales bacterium]